MPFGEQPDPGEEQHSYLPIPSDEVGHAQIKGRIKEAREALAKIDSNQKVAADEETEEQPDVYHKPTVGAIRAQIEKERSVTEEGENASEH